MLTSTNSCKEEGHKLEAANNPSIGDKNVIFRIYICTKCGETTKVEIK